MEVKNNDGKVLYHVQSLTDWHEPVDMFVFSDHEPNAVDIRILVGAELSLDDHEDVEAIDDFIECTRVYYVYAHSI